MKTIRKIMIGLGLLVLIGLSGCSKSGGNKGSEGSEEKNMVGKWQQIEAEGEPQIIEFLEDERVLIYDLKDINKKEEKGLPGDYRFIGKKGVRMNVALFGPIDAEISSSGDEIILTSPFGEVEKYRKLEDGDKPSVKNDRETQKRKLSRKETKLLGKYVGQMDNGSEISLEFKPDGTALVTSLIMAWEVIWSPRGNAPYTPTLTLMFYQLSGDSMGLSYHTSDGEKAIHIPVDFDSCQIDYWHRRLMDSQEILARQPEADLIKLDKREVKVWDEDERTICPGEVAIWNKYISKSGDHKTVLELKRIPDFKPPGWKRLTGCDGFGFFYTIAEWEISGNKIKIKAGDEMIGEFEIKDKTSADEKEGIIFVKQNSRSLFLVPVALPAESRSSSQREETSGLENIDPSEMLWVKCKNSNCGAEYQMSKKEYFKYIEEHANPMASTASALICEKCGEQSIYIAEKCGNPDCGLVFFRGTVPNDFPDRCPKCGYSETEEQRKSRMSSISSSRVSSPSETTDPDPAWRSRRARNR